ncbi:uncharacterized protein LOC122020350 isoform X1 [Zingiber officinale]|uniref:Uncharacterized protein n=1 Tax=Zingiber officinale TaxID=94328 RepID=A0A8J5F5P9_ZINOF|nr:uncharacterized protein LOC122020350 isoform X1 [Zingiber officinale]XP_042434180.1 uncharacterized protein LOC122020350 isoform X1 [Zingiber officinale]XP_042434181.1 uncharacterized protein LOC122020350 isoform X1 [Zingiber officinale]KAG6479123.1 hypothetical protein ZIOFF_062584 [Zingiber officinale]
MDREHEKACHENGNASLQQGNADANVTVALDEPDLPELQAAPKSLAPSSSTSEDDDLFQIDAGTGQGVVFAPAGIPLSFDATSAPGSINVGIARGNQCPIPLPYGSDVPAHRIPSSVFARTKSTTPMEWSVTSNESLFSIHMGKSGDLSSLNTNQFDGYPPVSPDINASSLKDTTQVGSNLQQTIHAEAMKDGPKATAEKHVEEDRPPTVDRTSSSDSENQFSDGGSVKSYRSFAFPILAGESTNGSFNGRSAGRPLEKAQLQPPVPQTPPQSAEPPSVEPVAPKKSRLPCFSCCSFCR